MKEKLSSTLGSFGWILYYIIMLLLAFSPLLVLDLPLVWEVIIIALMFTLYIPIIGDIVNLVIYIWAFLVAIQNPTAVVSIVFFVAFAIDVIRVIFSVYTTISSR